jgi:hypothetical protein
VSPGAGCHRHRFLIFKIQRPSKNPWPSPHVQYVRFERTSNFRKPSNSQHPRALRSHSCPCYSLSPIENNAFAAESQADETVLISITSKKNVIDILSHLCNELGSNQALMSQNIIRCRTLILRKKVTDVWKPESTQRISSRRSNFD